jgi:hypothetical protein
MIGAVRGGLKALSEAHTHTPRTHTPHAHTHTHTQSAVDASTGSTYYYNADGRTQWEPPLA